MKTNTILIALLLSICLTSCQEFVEDCILWSSTPEFKRVDLEIGYEGIPYSDYIKAEVRNDSNDEDYYYDFFVYGDLPPGMDFQFHRNRVVFNGTPTQKGIYAITIQVYVYAHDYKNPDEVDADNFCYDDNFIQREFVFEIREP